MTTIYLAIMRYMAETGQVCFFQKQVILPVFFAPGKSNPPD
jgi:hypothetical protein